MLFLFIHDFVIGTIKDVFIGEGKRIFEEKIGAFPPIRGPADPRGVGVEPPPRATGPEGDIAISDLLFPGGRDESFAPEVPLGSDARAPLDPTTVTDRGGFTPRRKPRPITPVTDRGGFTPRREPTTFTPLARPPGDRAMPDRDCFFPFREDPVTGECKIFVGDQPGRERGGVGGGQAVVGGFNMPAFVPDVVGNITRRDGSTGPILRCPTGTVLASDNLCYAKGTKGLAAHRKWKPGPRGFLPAKDVRCLRRSIAIKKSKSNKAMLRELGLG